LTFAALPGATAAPVSPILASGSLASAISDPVTFLTRADAGTALQRTRAAGATMVRLVVPWQDVAPAGYQSTRPTGLAASNPADPSYKWANIDNEVKLATANHLEPILNIVGVPLWAEVDHGVVPPGPLSSPTYRPSVKELALFATAAAKRYSGSFKGFPRVRYWQVWNEPNQTFYLSPQYVRGRPVAAVFYRAMVNAFADAVHGVHPDNLVVAGGLGPTTFRMTSRQEYSEGPLAFLRELLCLSPGANPSPTCSARVKFDIFSVHPYTTGGPMDHAKLADDVFLGDLPKVAVLLKAGLRSGQIQTRGPLRFWVTEISWNSNPPDPHAVPVNLLARWVSEAMYQMWRSEVSLITWFRLTDDQVHLSHYQLGLYYNHSNNNHIQMGNDIPKPTLAAFFFPFVAYVQGSRLLVWGRTPWGESRHVLVERSSASGWRSIGILTTSGSGIFTSTFHLSGTTGYVRARVVGADAVTDQQQSLPFSLVRPKDFIAFPFAQ
jgi:hypothetical protein